MVSCAVASPPRFWLKNLVCLAPGSLRVIDHATMRPSCGMTSTERLSPSLAWKPVVRLIARQGLPGQAAADLRGRLADLGQHRRGGCGGRERAEGDGGGHEGVLHHGRIEHERARKLRAEPCKPRTVTRVRRHGCGDRGGRTGTRVPGRAARGEGHRPRRRPRARSTASSAPTAPARRPRSGCWCTLLRPTGGRARVAGFDVAAQPAQVRRASAWPCRRPRSTSS